MDHRVADVVAEDGVTDARVILLRRILGRVDADDGDAVGIGLFDAAQGRQDVEAVDAAGGPEVENDQATAKIGQGKRAAHVEPAYSRPAKLRRRRQTQHSDRAPSRLGLFLTSCILGARLRLSRLFNLRAASRRFRRYPPAVRGQAGDDCVASGAGAGPAIRSIMAAIALIWTPDLRAKSAPVKPHQSQQPCGFGQGDAYAREAFDDRRRLRVDDDDVVGFGPLVVAGVPVEGVADRLLVCRQPWKAMCSRQRSDGPQPVGT